MEAPPSAAEVRALARILDELSYYEVLELAHEAPASAIRQAYHRAARRFHPDAHRDAPAPLRREIARVAKRVAEAYSVLRDARRRQFYDQQMAQGQGARRVPIAVAHVQAVRQRRDADEGATPNGRRYFRLAKSDLARGHHAAAERNLRTALTFEPQNAVFRETLEKLLVSRG